MEAGPALRPLRIGEVLDVAIKIVRRNLGTLVMAVLVVVVPLHVLALSMSLSTVPDNSRLDVGAFGNTTTTTGTSSAFLVAQLLAIVLGLLATTLSLAACFKAIGDAYLGAPTSWKASLAYVVRRAHSVIWVTLLVYILGFLALIPVLVPGFWLWISWTVAVPALLLEGHKGFGALRRSFRLVRHRWWPTFAAVAVGTVMASVVGGIIQGLAVAPIVSSSSDAVALTANGIGTVLSALITTPFQAAIAAVIYFDLRVRKEGFDLQLLAERLGLPAPAPGAGPAPVGPQIGPDGAEQPPYWPPPPGWRPAGD